VDCMTDVADALVLVCAESGADRRRKRNGSGGMRLIMD
jgi:hypothetical protein